MVLNVVALWKQEARDPSRTRGRRARPELPAVLGAASRAAAGALAAPRRRRRSAPPPSACRTSCSSRMAAQILKLCGRRDHRADRRCLHGRHAGRASRWPRARSAAAPIRIASRRFGALVGIVGVLGRHLRGAACARRCCSALGTALIGFGGGLFAAGTLTAAMALARDGRERPCARRLGRGAGDRRRRRDRARAASLRDVVSRWPRSGALGER